MRKVIALALVANGYPQPTTPQSVARAAIRVNVSKVGELPYLIVRK